MAAQCMARLFPFGRDGRVKIVVVTVGDNLFIESAVVADWDAAHATCADENIPVDNYVRGL